jgi:Lon protease-like protein
MSGSQEPIPARLKAPLFPLPNMVLFPRAILPLHIFEDRYKRMTESAIEGDGRIAMALLRPGWEKDYHCRPPIEPVVCVGRIVAQEKVKDGKFNILLQGEFRAIVGRETGGRPLDPTPYRLAELTPLPETAAMEIDLFREREELQSIFSAVGGKISDLFSSPMRTADIADLIAFRYLESIELKQSLLAEGDVRRRVERLVGAMRASQAVLTAVQRRGDSSGLN